MSDSLQPQGLQNTRVPCLSLSPRSCSNSCPLTRWCCPTISSSVAHFSSCRQSFPASGSFLVSWLLTSGGQSTGTLASASVLPMNIQDWFPLGWTGSIPCSPRDSQESSSAPQFENINSFHICRWLLEKLALIHNINSLSFIFGIICVILSYNFWIFCSHLHTLLYLGFYVQ